MVRKKWSSINGSLNELLWGRREPVAHLMEKGTLPAGWSERYCQLLTEAEDSLFASVRAGSPPVARSVNPALAGINVLQEGLIRIAID